MQQVVERRDLAKVAWHGYKKLGAVSWGHRGGKLRGLQVWGRWWSQAQPRFYWKTPPRGTLPSEVHVPWPVGRSGWIPRDVEGKLVPPKSLWPEDAWAPVPSVLETMFSRRQRDDPEPDTSGSDTSSVATSDDDEENEHPAEGGVGPVELLEEFQAVAEGQEV